MNIDSGMGHMGGQVSPIHYPVYVVVQFSMMFIIIVCMMCICVTSAAV